MLEIIFCKDKDNNLVLVAFDKDGNVVAEEKMS
jgi:hypothetical protein